MRVGALPAFPTNALKYNLTWSVDGLINEYCHPCEAIHEGAMTAMLPLEGLEHFSLDGVEYEAFNTSGGLGTLCETLSGKVRNLDYISAAWCAGVSTPYLLAKEILPNIASHLAVVATLEMALAILLEAALSFLGLGVPPPLPSWGLMIRGARSRAKACRRSWFCQKAAKAGAKS